MKLGNCKSRAFTVVEFLVVMAVIALLVAICLPGIEKVKELAKQAACLSNASSLFKAECIYAADYSGSLPVYVPTDGNYRWNRAARQKLATPWGAFEFGRVLVEPGYASIGMFNCPSHDDYPSYPPVWRPIFDTGTYPYPSLAKKEQLFSKYLFRAYTVEYYHDHVSSNEPADTGVMRIQDASAKMGMVADVFTWWGDGWWAHPNTAGIDDDHSINVVYGDGHGKFIESLPNPYEAGFGSTAFHVPGYFWAAAIDNK